MEFKVVETDPAEYCIVARILKYSVKVSQSTEKTRSDSTKSVTMMLAVCESRWHRFESSWSCLCATLPSLKQLVSNHQKAYFLRTSWIWKNSHRASGSQ